MGIFRICINPFGTMCHRDNNEIKSCLTGGDTMTALLAMLSVPMAKFAEGAILGATIFLASKGIIKFD